MTSRSEGIALRPFDGVHRVETYLKQHLSLRVTSAVGVTSFSPQDAFAMDKSELLHCGLHLLIEDPMELMKVASPLVQDDSHIDWVVLAEDGVRTALRGSQIVASGSLASLEGEVEIAKPEEANQGIVLGHPHASKKITFFLVQNTDVPSVTSIKPRTKGAILASVAFDLLITQADETLLPLPLTADQRVYLGLSKGTWFHFEFKAEELIESETLSGAFKFYVDEDMLRKLPGAAPTQRDAFAMTLYSLVVSNLVHSVSGALTSDSEVKLSKTAAITRLFNSIFSGSTEYRTDWPSRIVNQPQETLSEALSSGNSAKKILKLLDTKFQEGPAEDE